MMQSKAKSRPIAGFTLVEIMVGLAIFGIVGLCLVSLSSSSLRTLAIEEQASLATQELRNAQLLMSTELRMSSSISPYIVGTTPSSVTCSSAFSLTATAIRFLVVQDEGAAATAGLQPYYVGYLYDETNKTLLRGEIAGTTITSCTLPAGDPASTATAVRLADHVVRIDVDGNGTVDPAFVANGNDIRINLGVEVSGPGGAAIRQPMPISIYRRTS